MIKCCFFFYRTIVCILTVKDISFNVLKYIFLISAGGVACGRDLGRGQIFLLFLSLADHIPDASICGMVSVILNTCDKFSSRTSSNMSN